MLLSEFCFEQQSTFDAVARGGYSSRSYRELLIPQDLLQHACMNSRLYCFPDASLSCPAAQQDGASIRIIERRDAVIQVVRADCLLVARSLLLAGMKPVVLNMANELIPGLFRKLLSIYLTS